MTVPNPTPIYRFMHVDNLRICLRRGGLYAPSHTPNDGRTYRTIHNLDIQDHRRLTRIPCGRRGCVHDYVAFYFGYLSPMMLQLKTGQVEGYNEGQEPLIYLVSTAQAVAAGTANFVFSDGHGIATFTKWFDNLNDLDKVDWTMVYQRYWSDNIDDMDRQRRKQAEFLVYRFCPWGLVQEIAVIDPERKRQVELILDEFTDIMCKPVQVRADWYYY